MRELVQLPAGSAGAVLAMQAVRRALRAASPDSTGWQAAFDRLRPWPAAIWQTMGEAAQRRFLRHARRYWDTHRHRMAPAPAAAIAAMQASGRLSIIPGRVEQISKTPAGPFAVSIMPRGRGPSGTRAVAADYLVDCAGVDRDTRKSSEPLVSDLISRGLAKPDRHGLGFCTDDTGCLAGGGAPLYTIGPWRRGELWESVAVPELRVQAESVADAVLKRWSGSRHAGLGTESRPR
jgi:uncharacterized NAD(P)/FAD-binding protein YdhS